MEIGLVRERLERGETTSRRLCAEALARIADPAGEGATTFTDVFAESATAEAEAADRRRSAGAVASPLDGIPVSIKDLFDVAGRTTRAGSVVLAEAPPAAADAAIVARLRAAGAVIIGATNMTEFAYSGLGINPHYGTPRNPYDRATGRIPGGSSSGAAVSVSDGMAAIAIGTDTGGSVRIPAALCGLSGFKPTAGRVPLDGAYPLSFTLDSIGPLAASAAGCVLADAIMAGEMPAPVVPPPAHALRFLAPTTLVLDEIDANVRSDFTRALATARAAGATVDEGPLPALERIADVTRGGGFPAAEAYWWHRAMLARDAGRYDPHIARRIGRGSTVSAADYIDLGRARRAYIADLGTAMRDYDALLLPAVAIVAPPIGELLADDDAYARANVLILRNTSLINASDGCALTIPMHAPGSAPAGLMIAGRTGEDRRILAIGATLEAALRAAYDSGVKSKASEFMQ